MTEREGTILPRSRDRGVRIDGPGSLRSITGLLSHGDGSPAAASSRRGYPSKWPHESKRLARDPFRQYTASFPVELRSAACCGDEWVFGPETLYETEGDDANITFLFGYTLAPDGDTLNLYDGAGRYLHRPGHRKRARDSAVARPAREQVILRSWLVITCRRRVPPEGRATQRRQRPVDPPSRFPSRA